MSAIATLVKQTAPAIESAAAEAKQTAAKKAAPKAKKAAAKPASKAKVAPVKASASAIKHRVIVNRPTSGPLLWAHTAAWLELSGLSAGKSFAKREAIAVAGATAVNYHIGKGTFEQVGDKIKLTAAGKLHFRTLADKIDPEQQKAFAAILKGGKPDGAIIKNKAAIGPMPE